MIKANKDRLTVSGEITVVAAEFMSLTAYMAEIFGADDVIEMVAGALEEVAVTEDDEEPPFRSCSTCDNDGWSMPQCQKCDINNGYMYWRAKDEMHEL